MERLSLTIDMTPTESYMYLWLRSTKLHEYFIQPWHSHITCCLPMEYSAQCREWSTQHCLGCGACFVHRSSYLFSARCCFCPSIPAEHEPQVHKQAFTKADNLNFVVRKLSDEYYNALYQAAEHYVTTYWRTKDGQVRQRA